MPNTFSKVKVRTCNRALFAVLGKIVQLGCALVGIRVSFSNRCGSLPDGPAIVLCNHGSLLDFAYTATVLAKRVPHFVIARYFFYHKWLSALLQIVGGFPKSQLELDVESTRNCLRVLQDGGVLAMMPEARISSDGRFEDIQEGTYSFLKKVKVPVYTIRLDGNYLSYPKWASAPRRGSLVESKLDLLFSAEDLDRLTVGEIKQAVESRLYYDEFQWLKTRPNVRYRCRRLAEGLENILSVCPVCMERHSITTKNRTVYCEHCGTLASLDDRYGFSKPFRFENFAEWYQWQTDLLREKILRDPAFSLQSRVELQVPSEDGKTFTRPAGNGICVLNREGLSYVGTRDGEPYEVSFSLRRIYRLIYGAGEGFQIYDGPEMLYFLPEERRSAVDWYLASKILHDET